MCNSRRPATAVTHGSLRCDDGAVESVCGHRLPSRPRDCCCRCLSPLSLSPALAIPLPQPPLPDLSFSKQQKTSWVVISHFLRRRHGLYFYHIRYTKDVRTTLLLTDVSECIHRSVIPRSLTMTVITTVSAGLTKCYTHIIVPWYTWYTRTILPWYTRTVVPRYTWYTLPLVPGPTRASVVNATSLDLCRSRTR